MAQYKVPQDVEADDKLLGPFNFRQFVYLMISGGLIALAIGLFQLFPLLAIIPLPPVVLFVALALPLKKDQPMETYLAAIVSYYIKPRSRVWMPGQREVTIAITAPKKVEESRTRDITSEEATHRLSFLADIVDTEGYAIKGINNANPMRDDLLAEANTTEDMFEGGRFDSLANTIQKDETIRHAEVVKQMQETISETESALSLSGGMMAESAANSDVIEPVIIKKSQMNAKNEANRDEKSAETAKTAHPVENSVEKPVENFAKTEVKAEKSEKTSEKTSQKPVKPSIIELANNDAFSVATIAKQAKRVKRKEEGEIFISLH